MSLLGEIERSQVVDRGVLRFVTAGSVDGPVGVAFEGHIYCADAGDYYVIAGDGYRKQAWED